VTTSIPTDQFSAAAAAPTPPAVDLTERLESLTALDPVVRAIRPLADALVADPDRRDLLRGAWLGHAVHPVLTDVPIGLWVSAVTLDLVGGRAARPAARRLIGLGVLSFVPTALTGWAEFSGIGAREQRVGVVHAVTNAAAAVGFAASWRARGRGQLLRGKALALAASATLGAGGYLGGHLVSARKVSSRHPAFGD
jgi:uncharacterized membrane protein